MELAEGSAYWTPEQIRRQNSRLRGGPSVYQGGEGAKFEIKHKSRCLQKSKLVNCGGQACRLEGPGPSGLTWRRPCSVATFGGSILS